MKKIAVILLVLVLVSSSLFAASGTTGATQRNQWGVGLNLGTNTGLAIKYGYGNFDFFSNIGFDVISALSNGGLGATVDLGASFCVYDVDFGGGHHMPITVGVMVPISVLFANNDVSIGIGVLAQGGLEYQIPDFPLAFYLRLGLGLQLDVMPSFNLGFGYSGAVGILFVF